MRISAAPESGGSFFSARRRRPAGSRASILSEEKHLASPVKEVSRRLGFADLGAWNAPSAAWCRSSPGVLTARHRGVQSGFGHDQPHFAESPFLALRVCQSSRKSFLYPAALGSPAPNITGMLTLLAALSRWLRALSEGGCPQTPPSRRPPFAAYKGSGFLRAPA